MPFDSQPNERTKKFVSSLCYQYLRQTTYKDPGIEDLCTILRQRTCGHSPRYLFKTGYLTLVVTVEGEGPFVMNSHTLGGPDRKERRCRSRYKVSHQSGSRTQNLIPVITTPRLRGRRSVTCSTLSLFNWRQQNSVTLQPKRTRTSYRIG